MARVTWFVSLALALVVAGAPVALEVCLLTCASATHEAQTGHSGHDHSCHHFPARGGAALSTVPHACGHADELQAGSSAGSPPRAKATTSAALPGALSIAAASRTSAVGRRVLLDLHQPAHASPVPLRI